MAQEDLGVSLEGLEEETGEMQPRQPEDDGGMDGWMDGWMDG